MKTLKTFLCEADIDWIGSGWEPSKTYQIIKNHYCDKLTPENIQAQLNDLVNNHKWDLIKGVWVKKSSIVDNAKDIDDYIKNLFNTNNNYSDYKFNTFDEYVEAQYDSFVNFAFKKNNPHDWVKDENGNVVDLNKWLKMPSQYSRFSWEPETTWSEYYEKKWEDISKKKEQTIKSLHQSLLNSIKNVISVNEKMIRNIRLNPKCIFGAIKFHSGSMAKSSSGYLKISDKSTKTKLVLEYTNNKAESIPLRTVGELLDLLMSYKETKLLTESADIGSKFANSINISFDGDFKNGTMGVLKFKG